MDEQIGLQFDNRFMERHAGAVIKDPLTAVVELLANAWDAGARTVRVTWPTETVAFSIIDDGVGMTPVQFRERWTTIDYDRRSNQGLRVEFPPGVDLPPRAVFGRNGRGRHAPMCFAESYTVTTRSEGIQSAREVRRGTERPLEFTPLGERPTATTGTTIVAGSAGRSNLTAHDVRMEIGLRFLADPSFEVWLDGDKIEFADLPGRQVHEEPVSIEGVGTVTVLMVDVQQTDRTSKHHGIAWRVGNRLVGQCNWKSFGDNRFLDGRRKAAKRYTFIVFADLLEDAVLTDWSGFDQSHPAWEPTKDAVNEYIRKMLLSFTEEDRREVADSVRQRHHSAVKKLSPAKRSVWNQFVDQVLQECPTLTAQQVSDLAGVLANLEMSSSQYGLIGKLAELDPNDLDKLHDVLDQWTLDMAKVVLDEVAGRLLLIDQLTAKVSDPSAHEVQELQPLFKQGLWIFGPEFETIEFTSNEGMTTVIQKIFGGSAEERGSRNRPDFVVLPKSTVGLYAYDEFDDEGAEIGAARLVIVELKRPGVTLGDAELGQVWKYVKELRNRGHLRPSARVTGFVLGDRIDPSETAPRSHGDEVMIRSMQYDTILKRARSRMFRLYERVKEAPFLDERRRQELADFVDGDRSIQRNLDLGTPG